MELISKIQTKKAKIGVIGLGYVGLPLVVEFCRAGFKVTGFDVDDKKVKALKQGRSYIKHIDAAKIASCGKSFVPTTDFSKLADIDCILICVPTPLNKYREPDLTYVFETTGMISKYLRKGQLIILESTTYPGTTDEDMKKILEQTGMKAGKDFYLAFSPEREDPNNKDFSTSTIPKVVGGYTPNCLKAAKALYECAIVKVIPVSSTRAAEATKLLENIYRAVNIAMVNELKMLFDRMDIDVWEVIEAASTKPFGYHAFYPGPGLGGHCIPIDPFYLTWKAREYDFATRFIELAGEINTQMPYYVVEKTAATLSKKKKTINGANILILGMAYKKDIDDQRESPSLRITEMLKERGAKVSYNDPFVPVCEGHRHYPGLSMKSVRLTSELLKKADIVLLLTDHTDYDYKFIAKHANCIIDTRNAFAKNKVKSSKIVKA
ncbi:MAG: nucleotide sugar dehydrogenase [Dissulfurispiraceae bacterium]|jgi:UDP-N-acetyl-D-glucosamine dehydrogenase|nr:nucleotide sugar dehydrogenase [Dissulfurispiraceae bacterium]